MSEPAPESDLAAALAEHGLFAWLDLDIERVEPGHATFVLPFDEKLANVTSGTVHGGVTATVIDTASGFALRSTFDDPAGVQLTTTDLNVRAGRTARSDPSWSTGRRRGRRTSSGARTRRQCR